MSSGSVPQGPGINDSGSGTYIVGQPNWQGEEPRCFGAVGRRRRFDCSFHLVNTATNNLGQNTWLQILDMIASENGAYCLRRGWF